MNSIEIPEPLDPRWIRLSSQPLPPYCFVPGRSPHPRRDPKGHSHGLPEPRSRRVDPEAWRQCDLYLYGIDLYNLGYFWESHEANEALWHGAPEGTQRNFFQGLIQLAAANLKWRMGAPDAARALAERSLGRLSGVPSAYMGIDVAALRVGARACFLSSEHSGELPPITLADRSPAA